MHFLSLDRPHLGPTMFQPIVPVLFLGEHPPPFACWYTSKNRLVVWEGDSPSLVLSEANRMGRRRGRQGDLLFRRFSAGLTGCMATVSRRSNPGQSLPIRTGTGRSPPPRANCPRRPWSWRDERGPVSCPRAHRWWTGRPSSPGGGWTTVDCTRLTALPESKMAWYGRPFTSTFTRGASGGGSRWTMQPVSHARFGERGGSIGIGSSWGPGTAGLLTGLEIPSSVRRSWHTLRGNGGAHSHTSRCWVASANSMASMRSPTVWGFRMPAACRSARGRAGSKRSITTFSATWVAVGLPVSSQWWANRVRSAAWLRWSFTIMPAFSTNVTGWRITRQGEVGKWPGGWVYWRFFWGADLSLCRGLVLCAPRKIGARAFQWLSSVPCSCAGAGR